MEAGPVLRACSPSVHRSRCRSSIRGESAPGSTLPKRMRGSHSICISRPCSRRFVKFRMRSPSTRSVASSGSSKKRSRSRRAMPRDCPTSATPAASRAISRSWTASASNSTPSWAWSGRTVTSSSPWSGSTNRWAAAGRSKHHSPTGDFHHDHNANRGLDTPRLRNRGARGCDASALHRGQEGRLACQELPLLPYGRHAEEGNLQARAAQRAGQVAGQREGQGEGRGDQGQLAEELSGYQEVDDTRRGFRNVEGSASRDSLAPCV